MSIKVNDSKDPVAEQDSLLVQVDYANQPIPNNRLPKGLYYSFKNKWVDMITLLTPAIKKIVTANTTVPAWGSITGTLSNQTDLQSALDNKMSSDLTDSHIFVGDATNKATDVAITGDVTIDNTGATTLANTSVTAGTYGNSTNVPQIVVDSKGRITGASNVGVSISGALGYTPENVANKATSLISPDNTKYPTTQAVQTVFNTKQDTLVSGTNIRTVNGNSLLGSTDLVISASPSGSTGQIQFNNGGAFDADSNLFWDNTNKRLGVGATPASTVRLDVRAQGLLSTDIAFRVRNSTNTVDLFSVRGNGEMYIPQALFNNQNVIYFAGTTDSIIRYSPTGIGSVAFGQGASITNATYYNTVIGNSATSGASAAFGIAIGLSTLVNSAGGIVIGDRAKTSGTDTIIIGNTSGNTTYSGTRSIYLGKKGNYGNNFTSDDVFMTHFNSDNSSTLIRANGSLGLLGQQAYIFQNGTGIYGTDTFMGNGGNTFIIRNHPSIPSLNITDSFQQYSADITAGNAAPHFRTEDGSIIKLYKETTAVTGSTFVTNTSGILNNTATFDGYTIGQVVKALRNIGILA